MEASIRHVFINKKAFWPCDAASDKPNKVFVMNSTYQIDLIEEMIYPLCRVKAKPFYGYSLSIRHYSLNIKRKQKLSADVSEGENSDGTKNQRS